MQYIIQEDKVILRKGSLGASIAMIVIGGLLLCMHFFLLDGGWDYTRHYSILYIGIGLVAGGIVYLFKFFSQITFDKSGIHSRDVGDIAWDRVRRICMEKRDVFSWWQYSIFHPKAPRWGLAIYYDVKDDFIPFSDDFPQMELVQAISDRAPFEVEVDEENYANYKEAVQQYEQNKKAQAAAPLSAAEQKPESNSMTLPKIIGVAMLVLLIGLIVWRLMKM